MVPPTFVHMAITLAAAATEGAVRSVNAKDDPTDRPDWRDPASVAMLETWRKARDAYEGTDALLAGGPKYLPKHRKEKAEDYRARQEHSAVFNAFGAVIRGLVGLAYAKPPTLGADVPTAIRDHAENIDGRGTPLALFAKELTKDALIVGSSGFMVLYPPRPEGATAQDEKRGILRPYWIPLKVEDILSWDDTTIGAKWMLTLLTFREQVRVRKGRFGSRMVTRYREFRHDVDGPLGLEAPVTYMVWEEREAQGQQAKKREIVVVEEGTLVNGSGKNFSRIPFVADVVGDATSMITARPTLKDLLDLMLKGFRIDSDRTYLMHRGCVPIPVRKGYQPPKDREGNPLPASVVGAPNVLIDLPADTPQASGASFGFAEITGTAFEPTGKELEKIKAEMGAMGLSFLAPSTRAAETADARRMDARIENASLSSTITTTDSAIEEGLILHAEYMGLTITASGEQSGGSFTSNRDYERTILSEAMINTYSGLVLADQMTLETFYLILQHGRALPDGFDVEKEIARLRLLLGQRMDEARVRGNRLVSAENNAEDDDTGDDDATDDDSRALVSSGATE